MVHDCPPELSDNSAIYLNSLKMDELSLFRGQTVLLKGKCRRDTISLVFSDDHCDPGKVMVNRVIRKNLRVNINDIIGVHACANCPYCTRVSIVPFKDSIEGWSGDIFEILLKPYFASTFRPVRNGDTFTIPWSGREVEFKVTHLEPGEYGLICQDTTIYPDGEPIDRAEDEKRVTGYDDIGGCRRQLGLIREMVELPLRHPALFSNLGIKPPRGILMYGPPGCGKTLVARAIANETGAGFFMINGPEIISQMQGGSESNLRKIFQDATAKSPSIIFIDELDSIAPNREKTQSEGDGRVVAQLLTLMDGLQGRENVVVIAATNRPNAIDPALRRFGRFDREISIGVPDEAGRMEVLQIHTRKMKLAPDVDLEVIAKETHGFVGADLAALCTEAAMLCIREKVAVIDIDDDTLDVGILQEMAVTMDHFRSALRTSNPSSIKDAIVEVPDIRWEDIGGLESVKKELRETVEYPLRRPDLYAKFNRNPSRGVLFYGPPGCGKTLLAKAVATECQANFLSVKGPELLSMWFGESESNVRNLFQKARQASPCILFFDELDSIVRARGSSPGDSGGADRVINQLLTELDGLEARKTIFTIGATNRPELIDPAIMRPGRLDQLIFIPLPDEPARIAIFQANMRKVPCTVTNWDALGRATDGFSGADIAEICNRATRFAIADCMEEEQRRDIEKAKLQAQNAQIPPELEDDGFYAVTERHFDASMANARKSVSDDQMARYRWIARTNSLAQGRGSEPVFGDHPPQDEYQ
jgi:transitional endoplasmic reticulum ATPase